jgi:hypothetical protein
LPPARSPGGSSPTSSFVALLGHRGSTHPTRRRTPQRSCRSPSLRRMPRGGSVWT